MMAVPIEDFADRISEIMPAIMREFLRRQTGGFYKLKITMPQFVILDLVTRLEARSRMTAPATLAETR